MSTFQLPEIYIDGVRLNDEQVRVFGTALHTLRFMMKQTPGFGRGALPGVKLDIVTTQLLSLYDGSNRDALDTGT